MTDARVIKIVAKESLVDSKFKYEKIEGNFFTGLKVRGVSYDDKALFDSATLHWNPLTLLKRKVTLQEVEVTGVEVENILKMLDDFKHTESKDSFKLNFSLFLNKIHLDINPYIFEGVKFSSFVFETNRLELSKDLLLNTEAIHLKFDSDLVNLKLEGSIVKSLLLIDHLWLKEIDSRAITTLVKRLKKRKSSETQPPLKMEPFLKKIEVKKIVATLKDVDYDPIKIYKTKIIINNGVIDPYNNYSYSVKRIKLFGYTNFGKIDYRGYIKASTIYAKGDIRLSKALFDRYNLPLNYKTLKRLPSELRLNHDGVWIDIAHRSKKLLKIESAFNIDVLDSFHQLHYDYSDNTFTVESNLTGKMPYSNHFEIKNRVVVDSNKGFRYMGDINISKLKDIPLGFVQALKGEFRGDSKKFNITLDSEDIEGTLKISEYKEAHLKLNSKKKGIVLKKILFLASLADFKNEKISFQSETFLDFKTFENSNVSFDITSKIFNLKALTALKKPYTSNYILDIPSNSSLKRLDAKLKFSQLKEIRGVVNFFSNRVDIKAESESLSLDCEYDTVENILRGGFFSLEGHDFYFSSSGKQHLDLKSNIIEIADLFKKIKRYYSINLPNIQGSADVKIVQKPNGKFYISLKSPHLKYLSGDKRDEIVTNMYDIDILLEIDSHKNIKVEHYAFKLDDNEYESRFYATKESYLRFDSKQIELKKIWINNKISLHGFYNFSQSIGTIFADTKAFPFKNKDFDLLLDFGLNLEIAKNQFALSGDIDIWGNTISYEVIGSDIVEDSDIVILKEYPNEKQSIFKSLVLDLKINSKKSLKYLSKDMEIAFFNDLRIIKKYNKDIIVTGMSSITEGNYRVEGKKFILNPSYIYFAGDPRKPLLDIKVSYEKDQYLIYIFISGSTEEPIVNFTSEPYLTQQEILSLILFDGTGESNGGGAEAYTLLGGTFAKGLIKSLGINVDHLLLGTDAKDNFSFEIGGKVSNDVTVMYQHEDGKNGVKVRVEHNKNFETDIIIQPPNSSSIELLYKYSE